MVAPPPLRLVRRVDLIFTADDAALRPSAQVWVSWEDGVFTLMRVEEPRSLLGVEKVDSHTAPGVLDAFLAQLVDDPRLGAAGSLRRCRWPLWGCLRLRGTARLGPDQTRLLIRRWGQRAPMVIGLFTSRMWLRSSA